MCFFLSIDAQTFHWAQPFGCQFPNQDRDLQTDILHSGDGFRRSKPSGPLVPNLSKLDFCLECPFPPCQPGDCLFWLQTSGPCSLVSSHHRHTSDFTYHIISWRLIDATIHLTNMSNVKIGKIRNATSSPRNTQEAVNYRCSVYVCWVNKWKLATLIYGPYVISSFKILVSLYLWPSTQIEFCLNQISHFS